jgi:hypothetical protein
MVAHTNLNMKILYLKEMELHQRRVQDHEHMHQVIET